MADAFENSIREMLARGDEDEQLINVLDTYEDLIESAAQQSADNLSRAVKVFVEAGRSEPATYAWNMQICALGTLTLWDRMLSELGKAVDYSLTTGAGAGTRLAIENAVGLLRCSSEAGETLPQVVAIAERFFARFPDPEAHVSMLCEVATHYAAFKAFQSAYRAAGQAEQIAIETKSLPLRARALEAAFTVAVEEEDSDTALEWGRRVFEMYRHVKGGPPFRFMSNYALVLMNNGAPAKAIKMYERALRMGKLRPEAEGALMVNLSVCYRLEERHDDATRAVDRARGLASGNAELAIEVELVAAKNAVERGEPEEVLARVNAAATHISAYVSSATRLHFRRGMREAFLPRVEKLLGSIPNQGSAEDVIGILAECRCGVVSDWLGLRDWAREVAANENIPAEEREALERALDAIKRFGAPFLFGFREKHDDSLAHPTGGFDKHPWDVFLRVLTRLQVYGINDPFQHSNGSRLAALMRSQLARGAWLFVAVCPAADHIVVIGDGRYRVVKLPADLLKNWWIGVDEYRANTITRKEATARITACAEGVRTALAPAFAGACASDAKEFWFLPNALDAIPFHAAVLTDPVVRDRMRVGDLQVWSAPVLYVGNGRPPKLRTALAVTEPTDNLRLATAELAAVRANLPNSKFTEILASESQAFTTAMAETDLLLVASHGKPLSDFKDPIFSSMGGPNISHCIAFDTLQLHAEDWPCEIAILNACNSGASKAGNYQQHFKTPDLASYPVALMLNRRASVIAAAWPTLESASCLFTHLFLQGVGHHDVGIAFAQAVATMASMTGSEANAMLRNVGVAEDHLMPDSSMEDMLHHPYCHGTFQLYGLLR